MTNDYYRLNEIYNLINQKMNNLLNLMIESGFSVLSGYFPGHYCKLDGAFFEEKYPIPVLTVNEVLDIGIDIDNIFLEFRMTKEVALSIDYNSFKKTFELYGLQEFLDDLHNSEMDLSGIKEQINNSSESEFGLSFSFSYDEDEETLLEIVENLLYQ